MQSPAGRDVSQGCCCSTGQEDEFHEVSQSLTITRCDTLGQGHSSMTSRERPMSFLRKCRALSHSCIKIPKPTWTNSPSDDFTWIDAYACGLRLGLSTEGPLRKIPPLHFSPRVGGKAKTYWTSWLQVTKANTLECWRKEKLGHQSPPPESRM